MSGHGALTRLWLCGPSPGLLSFSPLSPASSSQSVSNKAEREIHAEIQGIIRQITASVTFLPMMEDQCTSASSSPPPSPAPLFLGRLPTTFKTASATLHGPFYLAGAFEVIMYTDKDAMTPTVRALPLPPSAKPRSPPSPLLSIATMPDLGGVGPQVCQERRRGLPASLLQHWHPLGAFFQQEGPLSKSASNDAVFLSHPHSPHYVVSFLSPGPCGCHVPRGGVKHRTHIMFSSPHYGNNLHKPECKMFNGANVTIGKRQEGGRMGEGGMRENAGDGGRRGRKTKD